VPFSFLHPLAPFIDPESRRCAQHARQSRRSWWSARLSTIDDWVHEWDPDPSSPNGHIDWPRLPKYGRQALRLYCPNGKFAQLGDMKDASGKLFQFKSGTRNISIGGDVATETRSVQAHVVGMVTGLDGECVLYAWELVPEPPIPADAPKAPIEQEWIAKSAEPGLYQAAVMDWEKRIGEYELTPQYRDWSKRYMAWEANAHGRLVGPLTDNVYQMTYQNVGRVSADHLGIDDGEGR
jgi:hypothetical protein